MSLENSEQLFVHTVSLLNVECGVPVGLRKDVATRKLLLPKSFLLR